MDRAFHSAVRGPVLFWALSRLALIRRTETADEADMGPPERHGLVKRTISPLTSPEKGKRQPRQTTVGRPEAPELYPNRCRLVGGKMGENEWDQTGETPVPLQLDLLPFNAT